MRTVAPAKINWTLEVLGRRDDGYHEIRSVMQTIDLCDELWAETSGGSSFETTEGSALPDDDLIPRAARALEERVKRRLPARIRVEKQIPVASGLGGGSSNAAAVLRTLERMWELGMGQETLAEVAAGIGSDAPFFLSGGTGLAEGNGECVRPLSDARTAWLVLLAPPIKIPEKTRRMYQALTAGDFGDGSYGEALTQRLQRGESIREDALYNVFERVADDTFEGLEMYRDALLTAGAEVAHLAGAGPALFTLAENEAAARELSDRVQAPEAKVLVARTLGAAEATAIVE
jgi:4-diphosphocytidyl-2-C-methyl-D-erythritol kinase